MPQQPQIVQQRIKQIFEFLKAFNEHRNPAIRHIRGLPWVMWLDDLPQHSSIDFPQRVAHSVSIDGAQGAGQPGYVLRVRRPMLTTAPPPPEDIRDWVRPGWDNPHSSAEHFESRDLQERNQETVTIRFADDPVRQVTFDRWRATRDEWRRDELPARAAMSVFERLYALHGQLQRESERFELIVGDGILSWQQTEGNIYHPVLLQRVQLLFDAKKPEFLVVDADVGSELHMGLFQSVAEVEPTMLRAVRSEFEASGCHPLDQEVNGVLEGLAHRLHGTFRQRERPTVAATNPAIGRAPVLFLRSRTKGFGTAIQQVLDSVQNRTDFGDALKNIVGGDSTSVSGQSEEPRSLPRQSPPERPTLEVLFGKKANPEQVRIARAVDRHGSVIVQGPPGTGKSHTIANLIGHLLAHQQSVLVTSHTTKALRVLREHLVEELRPLSVSVLESDVESRRQLEESVESMYALLNEGDADELERKAKALEKQRAHLLEQLSLLQDKLKNARADEYRDVVYGGVAMAPSEAARLVADGKGQHDWLPGPVLLGEPCPLSAEEFRELYRTNALTCPDDDRYIDESIPAEVPAPEDVDRLFQLSSRLADTGKPDPRYWPHARFTTAHINALESLVAELRKVVDEFASFAEWQLAAIDAGRISQGDHGPWDRLLAKTIEACDTATKAQTDLVVHCPHVGDKLPLQDQIEVAAEIHRFLANGGRLGRWMLLLHPRWKKAISGWRTHGAPPATTEQITAIHRHLLVKRARGELQVLWDGLMVARGAPTMVDFGDAPETTASQFVPIIRDALKWWSRRLTPIEQRLRENGFDWQRFLDDEPPNVNSYGELRRSVNAIRSRLIDELERTKYYLTSLRSKNKIDETHRALGKFCRPEVVAIRAALKDRDSAAYSNAYQEVITAANRREVSLRRQELLGRLAQNRVAACWADAIMNRQGRHGDSVPPGDVAKAWEWRQLNDELERRARVDLEAVGREIERTQDELDRVTNDLIERKAWAGQVRRTGIAQRQALMGWKSIVGRIGKEFGKLVPKLKKAAQEKMEECRGAVPVWIMPLSRLVESFDFSAPRFHVVIIDEASQCDVMALVAIALGEKVIVVGDDKQVSPLAVGQNLDIVHKLIRIHLDGIPNAVLYDGRMSIYDLAKQSFPGMISLVEHFRCVPDIIQFSNHLSYEGAIKPLREQASSSLTPHVVPYRVEGGIRGSGKLNPKEAIVVASLIVAACQSDAYANQTIGVISLLGDEQAMEIERLLLRHLAPDEYERRRIICGNSAHFQGDERDVIFLSMVQSPGKGPLPMLDRPETRQRYNVAVSRARNQLWVVYSMNHVVDLKPGDLRRRLIEHALDPQAITREMDEAQRRTESPFEQQVLERLLRRGYRVRPQWPVGRYRIDMVIEGAGRRRVALECDGDRYHPIEKLPEDMERQAILERLGWRFIRIRGSSFFRDPDAAMERVFKKLEELEIAPESSDERRRGDTGIERCGVADEVIRRAADLRMRWAESETEADTTDDSVREQESTSIASDVTIAGQKPNDVLAETSEAGAGDVRTTPSNSGVKAYYQESLFPDTSVANDIHSPTIPPVIPSRDLKVVIIPEQREREENELPIDSHAQRETTRNCATDSLMSKEAPPGESAPTDRAVSRNPSSSVRVTDDERARIVSVLRQSKDALGIPILEAKTKIAGRRLSLVLPEMVRTGELSEVIVGMAKRYTTIRGSTRKNANGQ